MFSSELLITTLHIRFNNQIHNIFLSFKVMLTFLKKKPRTP